MKSDQLVTYSIHLHRVAPTRVVDVHISRLRSKLETDPNNPEFSLTTRGTGYLFQRITQAEQDC
nr:winged helix-turn-helix domain-containing protein [Nostoc parmelioides]